jgi:hypothetical protein
MSAVMGGTETLCHHCCPIGLSSLSGGSLLWAEEVNSAAYLEANHACIWSIYDRNAVPAPHFQRVHP